LPRRNIGEGRFVLPPPATFNGLQSAIPSQDQPLRMDPPEGFLRSANQRVMGPSYPYYMGWSYEAPLRGRAIRRLLEGKHKISSADMMQIQNDDRDMLAEVTLPLMLHALRREGLSDEQRARVAELEKWDLRARAERIEPALYRQWYRELRAEIFADEYTFSTVQGFGPKDMRVAWMLARVAANPEDSDAQWIDDKQTPARETLSEITTRAFTETWETLNRDYGVDSTQWTWARWLKAQLPHVAKIPGFGSPLLAMNGAADSVNGNRGWHGAVYKFVIELGDWPRAWMQVPGGNNGDPFSPQFERFVREWSRGEMREVEFYRDVEDAKTHGAQVIELRPVEK
jgi:penicillin amidase